MEYTNTNPQQFGQKVNNKANSNLQCLRLITTKITFDTATHAHSMTGIALSVIKRNLMEIFFSRCDYKILISFKISTFLFQFFA